MSFLQNPQLRAVFAGASTPGIDWEAVEANHQLVIINCKGITDPASRSFAMQWIIESLFGHLKQRGRREIPFVVTINEFANLAASGTQDNKPLADLFDEFLAQYARNNRVFVTAALQSVDQVDERLQRTLFRLGTLITRRAGSMREARVIADHVFRKDIYRVQHYKKVWGKHDPPPFFSRARDRYEDYRSNAGLYNSSYPYFVLDYEPEHMSLENQTEDAAGTIQKLQALEFLCRPALSEGAVSQDVISLSIADALRDPDTDEYIFPDPEHDAALIAQLQHMLAARSGRPVTDSRTEQEVRLSTESPQQPRKTQPVAAAGEQQPFQLPDETQPAPRTAIETHYHPTLADNERAFLIFITEHPDMPVTAVYKELGIGVSTGGKLRESLKAQGLLMEIEVRAGNVPAGRPRKCLLPTFTALELLGIDPPKGRGGALHRHVQQLVTEDATAKGYRVTCEKAITDGAIVDVHLEKDGKILAVEIAIASKPEREIVHIRNCLNWGYDHVFCLIADETLLQRTETVLTKTFSPEEQGKIHLLPLSKYMHVG